MNQVRNHVESMRDGEHSLSSLESGILNKIQQGVGMTEVAHDTELAQDSIGHPNVVRSKRSVRLDGGNIKVVLVVETDLVLHPKHPEFDASTLDDLVDKVTAYIADRNEIDSAEINPV